jgi:hypothetical protein
MEWLIRYRKERTAAFAVVEEVQAQNQDISEEELQSLVSQSLQEVRKQARQR